MAKIIWRQYESKAKIMAKIEENMKNQRNRKWREIIEEIMAKKASESISGVIMK